MCVKKICILFSSLTIIISLSLFFLNLNVICAVSPKERGEIQDNSDDWYFYGISNGSKNKLHVLESNITKDYGLLPGNIDSVSYISDGKTLNITIWLSEGNKDPSSFGTSFIENPPDGHYIVYGMYIDTDADIKTGKAGADYALNFKRNSTSGKWENIFEEISSSGHVKLLDTKDDIKSYYNQKNGYVFLSLNLNTIQFPEQFLATFYIEYFTPKYVIWDFTNWINFPKPQYSITASSSSQELRPGQTKTIEFTINNAGVSTRVQPKVNLYVNNSYPNDIDLKFIPANLSIQNNVPALSSLYVTPKS